MELLKVYHQPGFFEALRAEEHDRGIVITFIVPGFIGTQITAHALTGSGGSFGRVLPIYRTAMRPDVCARKILRAVAQAAVGVTAKSGVSVDA